MCNEVARRIALGQLREDWSQLKVPLVFPEGLPNLAPLDSIRITDTTLILRAANDDPAAAEGVQRRWSWPGPSGKPVYNYRSDGRSLGNSAPSSGAPQSTTLRGGGGRCLIPVDGFYEFTAPADPKQKKKDKWRFTAARPVGVADAPGSPETITLRSSAWFCIAGLWRADPAVGEAFTLLTTERGPDIAPYHSRQVVVLASRDWTGWLDGSAASADLCRPAPAGTFAVERVA